MNRQDAMHTNLSDCTALVTGATSGIGNAIARALADCGARVAAVGRNREALDDLSSERVRGYAVDFEQDAHLQALAGEVGGADILVHSAGMYVSARWNEASVVDLDRQYKVNVRAPYLLTQALLPSLIERQGQVVFINSTAGLTGRAGVGQYAATKHALKALADSLREEVNPLGVRVISVYPGRTASPMQEGVFRNEGRAYTPERLLQPEDVASTVVHALTLPRTAEVTDLHIRPFQKT